MSIRPHPDSDKSILMQRYRTQRELRIRRRRQKRYIIRFCFLIIFLFLFFIFITCHGIPSSFLSQPTNTASAQNAAQTPVQNKWVFVGDTQFRTGYTAMETNTTLLLDDSIITSCHAILINEQTNEIIAQKDAQSQISPASMTKILTILVAAEHLSTLSDLNNTFTVSREITDFSYKNKCSAVGFLDEETVTVKDLFYGTILPSGADAALGLAIYTSGSQEAFVALMNQKLEELGLSKTAHFTNCVGLYDEQHYCTTSDMAMILKAALQNDLCREILSAHTYTTSATTQHPEGITISNWFLRRIEDKEIGGQVRSAKTGFVNQSGNCAASYAVSTSGIPYIAVTANTFSSWRCIYDHVALYQLAP